MRNFLFPLLFMAIIVSVSSVAQAGQTLDGNVENHDYSDWFVVIDDVDTITVGEFERAYEKNRIGLAQAMLPHDFLDEFLTFRLNVVEAKVACIDTLPEYLFEVSTHMMTLIQPELPPHLAALITSRDENVLADIVAATDSVYSARGDIREAVGEYGDYLLAAYIIEDYLEKEGVNNPDSLSCFFEETRDDYGWDEPRFKGYVVCVARHENPREAEAILDRNVDDVNEIIGLLRKAYGRNVRIGHVVMPRGVNAIVDYVAFGGEKNDDVDNWSLCKAVDGRIIDAPESFEDVRGAVTENFRKRLLERRFATLRAAHNVKINQNALKKIESLTDGGTATSSAQNK